jgi:cellulose synthase/poly-beta-1,6-N-acetylglucosamine synthase-like glycosyltransferase
VVSAHGGLYAIRRALFRPVADGGITDDFAISTAVVEQGYRLVFEPQAVAHEYAVPEARREFRRRVRLMTRGLRAVAYRRRLLNPFRFGFYSLVLASHKIGRRLVFAALGLLLVSSLALWPVSPWYRVAAVAQLLFYALAAAGALMRRSSTGRATYLYLPFYLVMANAACALAWVRALRGERIELWQPQRHSVGS